jgi:hypothetical protein
MARAHCMLDTSCSYYSLLSHCNNGCTNAPQCYDTRTMRGLFYMKTTKFLSKLVQGVWLGYHLINNTPLPVLGAILWTVHYEANDWLWYLIVWLTGSDVTYRAYAVLVLLGSLYNRFRSAKFCKPCTFLSVSLNATDWCKVVIPQLRRFLLWISHSQLQQNCKSCTLWLLAWLGGPLMVAQWLRYCATNRKVGGMVSLEFSIDLILLIALRPWCRLSL